MLYAVPLQLFNSHCLYLSIVLPRSFWGDLINFIKSLISSLGSVPLPIYYSVTCNY